MLPVPDFESGLRSGVNATHTFFINDEKYVLDWEGEQLAEFLNYKLGEMATT